MSAAESTGDAACSLVVLLGAHSTHCTSTHPATPHAHSNTHPLTHSLTHAETTKCYSLQTPFHTPPHTPPLPSSSTFFTRPLPSRGLAPLQLEQETAEAKDRAVKAETLCLELQARVLELEGKVSPCTPFPSESSQSSELPPTALGWGGGQAGGGEGVEGGGEERGEEGGEMGEDGRGDGRGEGREEGVGEGREVHRDLMPSFASVGPPPSLSQFDGRANERRRTGASRRARVGRYDTQRHQQAHLCTPLSPAQTPQQT